MGDKGKTIFREAKRGAVERCDCCLPNTINQRFPTSQKGERNVLRIYRSRSWTLWDESSTKFLFPLPFIFKFLRCDNLDKNYSSWTWTKCSPNKKKENKINIPVNRMKNMGAHKNLFLLLKFVWSNIFHHLQELSIASRVREDEGGNTCSKWL